MGEKLDLHGYGFRPKAPVMIFLPCSKEKPYRNSRSHKLMHLKARDYLNCDLALLEFATISETLGIIPESIETAVFADSQNFYDHYPASEDFIQTAAWLADFCTEYNSHYQRYFCYATAQAFRTICSHANQILNDKKEDQIELYPKHLVKSPLFEFRRKQNLSAFYREVQAAIIELSELKHYLGAL